jgi:hypothetical protein
VVVVFAGRRSTGGGYCLGGFEVGFDDCVLDLGGEGEA